MSFELLGYVLVLFLAGALLLWRWRVVNRAPATDMDYEQVSAQVVKDIFSITPGVGTFVPVSRSYWTNRLGMTDSHWIYLCRWMIGRGMVAGPEEWGRLAILLGNPPARLALTQRTWEFSMDSQRTHSISIGDSNGPINIGGTQVNISGQLLSNTQLLELVAAVRSDANSLPALEAESALAAADTLEMAANSGMDPSSPQVAGAISWLKKRAGEAVGGAAGTALWAGTVAMFRTLGIM